MRISRWKRKGWKEASEEWIEWFEWCFFFEIFEPVRLTKKGIILLFCQVTALVPRVGWSIDGVEGENTNMFWWRKDITLVDGWDRRLCSLALCISAHSGRADVLAKHRRLERSIIDERRIFRAVAASNVIGALLTNTFRWVSCFERLCATKCGGHMNWERKWGNPLPCRERRR